MSKQNLTNNCGIDLDRIQIASPCKVSWDSMTGNDQVRFCGDCQKNVFNVSAMSKVEAQRLLSENSMGSLCIRMYKRFDGTVLTDDCPVGLRRLRNTTRRLKAAAATFLSIFLSGNSNQANAQNAFSNKSSEPPAAVLGQMRSDHIMGGAPYIPPQQDPQKSVSATIVSYRTRWLANHRRYTDQAQRLVEQRNGSASNNTTLKHCEQMLRGNALDAQKREQRILAAISNNNAANCLYYQGKLSAALQLYQSALNTLDANDEVTCEATVALPILENAMLVEHQLKRPTNPSSLKRHLQLTGSQTDIDSIARVGLAWLHTEHGASSYTAKSASPKSAASRNSATSSRKASAGTNDRQP